MAAAPREAMAGRYRVIERLGSGGMASVFLAEDERLGRLVAVKRLPTSSPDEALARFRREARIGASLNHSNVVSIFDSTTDEDALLIVMEYVPGQSLKELLLQGPLEQGRALAILDQIAAALDHAHSSGVIHRDVKPANVLIADDGLAKLADLGIATAVDATSITTTNAVIGTLSYIAPERLEGAADDPSADVYSLAAVAFEALSGQRAQSAQTPAELVAAPGPPDLRQAWPQGAAAATEVLRDALSRHPDRRPRSAGELVRRLDQALSGGDETTAVATDATVPLPSQRRPAPPPSDDAAATPRSTPRAAPVGTPQEPRPVPVRRSRFRPVLIAALLGLIGAGAAIALLGGSSDSGSDSARAPQADRGSSPAPEPDSAPPQNTETTAPSPEPTTTEALDGSTLNDQGFALIQEGNYEEAVEVLQRAVEAFPAGTTDLDYAYALFNLGHALRLAGRPEEAISILEQRLEIPNQTDVVEAELAQAQADAGLAPAPSAETEAPSEDATSGGIKPGKGPKPKKDEGDEGDG